VISRVTFFMIIAMALCYYGENIRVFIEKHLPLATFGLLAIIIGGFFILPLVL
jgi:hypothetical protein